MTQSLSDGFFDAFSRCPSRGGKSEMVTKEFTVESVWNIISTGALYVTMHRYRSLAANFCFFSQYFFHNTHYPMSLQSLWFSITIIVSIQVALNFLGKWTSTHATSRSANPFILFQVNFYSPVPRMKTWEVMRELDQERLVNHKITWWSDCKDGWKYLGFRTKSQGIEGLNFVA